MCLQYGAKLHDAAEISVWVHMSADGVIVALALQRARLGLKLRQRGLKNLGLPRFRLLSFCVDHLLEIHVSRILYDTCRKAEC